MSDSEASTGLHQRLIRFLEKPEAYPQKPERVEHIQTHISHVFIAPPHVYKIKKPVDFGFLDYSSLDKRKQFCRREVELNRRLCDGVYLGVVPVTQSGDTFMLEKDGGRSGSVVEYAVKMVKLSEEHFLQAHVEKNTLKREHLDRIAEKLARFYREQEPPPGVSEYGSIEKIKVNTDENFRQTEPFIGRTVDEQTFGTVRYYTDRYYRMNESLFRRRVKENRIVDGHGDLHLEHIHLLPDRICIYDCIEFNERFRYGDLAVDLAFLAMDLDFNGRWSEERYFVDRMAKQMDDPDLHRIIDFYKCYRAYVKGKVKSLQSSEQEVSGEDRKQAVQKAVRYFDLSLRYAVLGSQPVVIIFMGRIASGKSTLAASLADKLSLDLFSSDRIRKSMAGLPLRERASESVRERLYSSEMSRKTYDKLQNTAMAKLEQGESVILDATFSGREGRRQLVRMLEDRKMEFLFVEAQAADETIKRRLNEREGADDLISDARLEDFEKIDRRYEPPEEMGPLNLVTIDTDRAVDDTVEALYRKLVDWHLANDQAD